MQPGTNRRPGVCAERPDGDARRHGESGAERVARAREPLTDRNAVGQPLALGRADAVAQPVCLACSRLAVQDHG